MGVASPKRKHDLEFVAECQDEANASLIAASPELLAALEELVTWWENWMPVEAEESGGCEATKTCKAAIAKAKGQP